VNKRFLFNKKLITHISKKLITQLSEKEMWSIGDFLSRYFRKYFGRRGDYYAICDISFSDKYGINLVIPRYKPNGEEIEYSEDEIKVYYDMFNRN
jgi:hypothetical protein